MNDRDALKEAINDYESGTVRYFYPGERVACRTI